MATIEKVIAKDPETLQDVQVLLAKKSVRWRTLGGTVAVLTVAWAYLIRPISDYILAAQGLPVPPPGQPVNLTDVLLILGLPLGGAYADTLEPKKPTL